MVYGVCCVIGSLFMVLVGWLVCARALCVYLLVLRTVGWLFDLLLFVCDCCALFGVCCAIWC